MKIVATVLALLLALSLGYSAGAMQTDLDRWVKRSAGYHNKVVVDGWAKAKRFCMCLNTQTREVGYVGYAVGGSGPSLKKFLFCRVPEFANNPTRAYLGENACSDWRFLAK